MLAATNNYDFTFEASLTTGVLDADGQPINALVEDNYSRDITRCCQKTISVLTSVVGTLVLLCSYLVAGAWMFQYLEKGNEVNACYDTYTKYLEKLNTSVIRATGIVDSGLPDEVISKQLESAMIDFADSLFALDFAPSRNCSLIHDTPFGSKWNWVNAIYFCATIVTTIGYGHVFPVTQWGRLVCMFYSLLGIPLLLIYLGSIGQLLAHVFRFVYMNICCCRCFRDIKIRRLNARRLRLLRLQEDLRRHMELQAKLKGEPIPPQKFTSVIMDDDSDADEEIREIYSDFRESEEAGIPITMVMLVIAAYVMIGTYLFRVWEKDWTIIDGAYFAVITISTIGFGDFVPGAGRYDDVNTVVELIVGSLYCIIGLALLSMCFELMKEEFISKVRWIGLQLRILSDRNHDEENDENSLDYRDMSAVNLSANEAFSSHRQSMSLDSFAGEMNEHRGQKKGKRKLNKTCCNHSSVVAQPQQRKSICVLRSHSRSKSSSRRKSVSSLKKSIENLAGEDNSCYLGDPIGYVDDDDNKRDMFDFSEVNDEDKPIN